MSTDDQTRTLLATLVERWQEVADAYQAKTNDPDDDLARRYSDYRHIYLRNIRDLKHALNSGRVPCPLMTDEERRRGDCGQVHDEAPAARGWLTAKPLSVAERRLGSMEGVLVSHLAEALIDGKGEEVRSWARSVTHELRRAGVDLREAIGARLTEIALGHLDEEHPF